MSITTSISTPAPIQQPSPSSSRFRLSEVARRLRRSPRKKGKGAFTTDEEDGALSSARNSILGAEDLKSHGSPELKIDGPPEDEEPSAPASPAIGTPGSGSDEHSRVPSSQYVAAHFADDGDVDANGLATARPSRIGAGKNQATTSKEPVKSPRAPLPRRIRRSLPSAQSRPLSFLQDTHDTQAIEREKQMYDLRAKKLSDLVQQNQRMRGLLKRVSQSAKEFDDVHGRLTSVLNNPGEAVLGSPRLARKSLAPQHAPDKESGEERKTAILPPALLDALNHDPAALTGHTTRLKGWRAVDDIHTRLEMQRAVLCQFVREHQHGGLEIKAVGKGGMGVFGEELERLMGTLERLERAKEENRSAAERVGRELGEVRVLQGEVKQAFNETVGRVSVVYPEASPIRTLCTWLFTDILASSSRRSPVW